MNLKLQMLWACMALAGCAPYASYTHLSDPRVAGDGYDLVCAGGIFRRANFEARTAGCYNAAPFHGEFVKVDISYVWDPNNRPITFADAEADEEEAPSTNRVPQSASAGRPAADGEL